MASDPQDPWAPIRRPDKTASVNARRVEGASRWPLYWAIDVDGHPLLMLQHTKGVRAPSRLPKLRGLLLENRVPDAGASELLVIRLIEEEQRDVFLRLCLDIVASTNQAATEPEAVERFIARTWRWHRLLTGGRDGRLSDDEQKGLLGELAVLTRILIPTIGAGHAVRCWSGPLGAPKDFEVGRVCIEAKARRGTALPHVAITSEIQLDTTGCDALFLHVAEVSAAAEDARGAVTLTEACAAARSLVEAQEPALVELLEERLIAAGFDPDDDYSDTRWIQGPQHLYRVEGDFPRVTPEMFPHGVSGVRYAVALGDCEPFRRDVADLTSLICGGSNVPIT